MTKVRTAATLVAVIVWPTLAAEKAAVTIESREAGFSVKQKAQSFTCTRDSGRCSIVDAANAWTHDGPCSYNLAALGIDESWLQRNARDAYATDLPPGVQRDSGAQADLFLKSFTDLALVTRAMKEYQDSWWTDDYPHFRLEIRTGLHLITVESTSQKLFMVPLTITADGQGFTTYDARISQAIGGILPRHFPNKARLLGSSLRYVVAQQVLQEVREKWNLLGSEARLADAFRQVHARYEILKSAIVNIDSFDVGFIPNRSWGGTTWDVHLKDAGLPSNFRIGLNLPYNRRQLSGLDQFFDGIGSFEAQMQKAGWLSKYASEHPDVEVELRFVTDRSFSEKAEFRLREQYAAHGQTALLESLGRELAASCSVEVDERSGRWSRWLVLPDGRALLYEFRGDSVLGRSASNLSTWDWHGWRGTATIFSRDGEIEQLQRSQPR